MYTQHTITPNSEIARSRPQVYSAAQAHPHRCQLPQISTWALPNSPHSPIEAESEIGDLGAAQRYVDSFSRPNGFNHHAWRVVKKLALNAWQAHFDNKVFQRPLNFMCKEFYDMIRTPQGELIVPRERIRSPFV